MCSPAIALVGLQVVSGVVQSRNELAQGQAANNYYQYVAKQQEQQAILAERTGAAQSRLYQDTAKSEGQRLKESQVKQASSQRAALASAGIVGGTTEDIIKDTNRTQLLDEASLRYDFDVKSYQATEDAKNQAYGLRESAKGSRYAGANELSASKRRAAGTMLGTATSVFNPFSSLKSSSGAFAMGSYSKQLQPISLLRR